MSEESIWKKTCSICNEENSSVFFKGEDGNSYLSGSCLMPDGSEGWECAKCFCDKILKQEKNE